MSDFHERAIKLIEQAENERAGLEQQLYDANLELHHVKRRLEESQGRAAELEQQVGAAELRAERAERESKNRADALTAHGARTT